jgi:hypothetical protein
MFGFVRLIAKPFMGPSETSRQTFLTEEERVVMSTAGFVAISILVLFASIVYEFTVISRLIAKKNPAP